MRNFFLEGFYFCLPPIVFCLFIFCIDPYNYFNVSKIISDDTKFVVANRSNEVKPRGNMLWKVLKFSHHPCRNIILGNSQGLIIREKLISETTGKEYFNFSVPGETLETTISIFWYIIKKIKPHKVFIQTSFNLSNSSENQSYNLFHFAQDYINKPYLYFLNKDILFDSYYNLKYEITKEKFWPEETSMLKLTEGKDSSSENALKGIFKNYFYPEKDILELKKISTYCMNNNIELEFIILPCYRRVDEFILENGLIEMRDRFRNDISTLGRTHDYLNMDAISNNENNFYDYFHQNQHITDSLTTIIWQVKKD